MTVASILKRKAFRAVVVGPTDSIAEIARVLSADRAEAALVVDETAQLLGVVAERDIVTCLAANGARALEMSAGQLVVRAVRFVTPRTTLAEAMRMMISGRSRHLPVMDRGELLGLIGLADVARGLVIEDLALAA